MDSIELLFLHLPTLKPTLRMNYIRARGIDDEDFKSSQSASSNRTTNSLSRAISTATSQHRQEENKIYKKSIQSMPWIYLFFFQFRVYSRCFNTIRILYTLFLRVNTFDSWHFVFFFYSYLDKTDKWTNLCTINRLRKLTDLNNGLCILVSFFFFFSTLNTQFSR